MRELAQMSLVACAERFAATEKTHVWLGGSFGRRTGGRYSDVDLAIAPSDAEVVRRFIYGYAQPVFLSKMENPRGILIIIYENGAAVDLEALAQIGFASGGGFWFTGTIQKRTVQRGIKWQKGRSRVIMGGPFN